MITRLLLSQRLFDTRLRESIVRENRLTRKIFSYRRAKTILFDQIENNSNNIYDYYTNKTYHFENIKRHYPLSVEHVMPRFYMHYSKDLVGDIHNFLPVDITLNSRRRHLKYIEGKCDSQICFYKNGVTINDNLKGIVSRILIYFIVCYEDEYNISRENLRLYVKWCENHPVSNKEIERNRRIKQVQGNRNWFVDNPQDCYKILY